MRDADAFDSTEEIGSGGRVPLFKGMQFTGVGLDFEDAARGDGFQLIAGVDEVGRGCLAGAVVAAACILDPAKPLPKGLNDSKKLTPKRREEVGLELIETALAFAVGAAEADEIDEINILQATKRAMSRALDALNPRADFLLIDALVLKEVALPQKAIIKGDSISASIAAASIIAKNHRDKMMRDFALTYPQYGFDEHVGYGTRSHLEALRKHGPCPLHRRSFRGVLH